MRRKLTTDLSISPDMTVCFPMPGPTVTVAEDSATFMSLLHSVDKTEVQERREANPLLADIGHGEVSGLP